MRASGIILGVPDHILSFKLSGLQRLSDSKLYEARKMVQIQSWMDRTCRDILDECDFTLAVKTQLIYPSGSLLPVDGHPYRWEVIQTVLSFVTHHLRDLARDFPKSIDILERTASGFPVTYFLRKDVEKALVLRIVEDVCHGRVSSLPIEDCMADLGAIRRFISQEVVDHLDTERVSTLFLDLPKARKTLYILRGLLAHGILILCLKKRWNVQYGLHPGRDPIAVPFHAKGVPSEQAEWGHPDVAILLTCLAFYHQGLSLKQLRQSLQTVLRSDDPATEYDRWTQGSSTLPEALRHWNLLNVDDDKQIAEIWTHLRFMVVVINHFLNNFVFPAHAKQFSVKLQTSGWDIPLFSGHIDQSVPSGFKRPGLTTGFSGTNDNRRLLPLTIKQHDLPGLSHTNAEVLTYLLQERNRQYNLAACSEGQRLSEIDLLRRLKSMNIRILIDAGAFILEMDNRTLVKDWLQIDPEAQAAVYFGLDNKPWVQYKTGKAIPLLATPFADNLKNCLVYLDEAHTRGTDLKLPLFARGALTLGLNQTKDHTVQAAMRLRQLGTSQSVTFVAPPEVHQSILDVCKKSPGSFLDSSNVVTWLLDQTCASNKDLQPLYISQGASFCHRTQAAETFTNSLDQPASCKAYVKMIEQPEQQMLEQLYEPREPQVGFSASEFVTLPLNEKLKEIIQELNQRQRLQASHNSVLNSALEEVEQEREVAYEIEEERELQRPHFIKPLSFPGLHQSILKLAKTGYLPRGDGYLKVWTALESTQLGMKHGIKISTILPNLYISSEFLRTVKMRPGERNDSFMRPVNWILWGIQSKLALVIMPEEAEALIPILRAETAPLVHLLTYSAPVTKRMLHFNCLSYYSIPPLPADWTPPPWLAFELGIFSGRLYFDFPEYDFLLNSLGLNSGNTEIADQRNKESRVKQTSSKKFLSFLQEWMAVRRQGQDITHTPMGYVCQGWQLRKDHPFFRDRKILAQKTLTNGQSSSHANSIVHNADEEEDYDSDDYDEQMEPGDIDINEEEYVGEKLEMDLKLEG
ncbi:conserved hypothetical protein [Uncinocarpus reesii 1704]|uniref:ubiquitinyl hydrolase 1 n=1 Tax=Uncinocarpus reesii (strain UAMH 1704) TaxID=336963 RepID=C4JYI3_UNCRE|nr:uncharacterized protein UREG_07234 [Uncinocarpus reesii 1704]EEP82369.1 conserved hypothetical protein [Uncinocarpus reesii 1704]